MNVLGGKPPKVINEVNMPDNVKKMFGIVKESIDNPKPKKPIIDFSNMRVMLIFDFFIIYSLTPSTGNPRDESQEVYNTTADSD